MLIPTEIFLNYSYIGIDPGLSQCGISIYKMNNGQLASVEARTIINNKIKLRSELYEEHHSDREIRCHRLCLAYRLILEEVNPILVCCESPFFNPAMPGAFGSLTDTMARLRLTTQYYNSKIPFLTYAPQEVKQTFKRAGKLGKETMREALSQDHSLLSKLMGSLDQLDEHSIDAIAVGYTYLLNLPDWSV